MHSCDLLATQVQLFQVRPGTKYHTKGSSGWGSRGTLLCKSLRGFQDKPQPVQVCLADVSPKLICRTCLAPLVRLLEGWNAAAGDEPVLLEVVNAPTYDSATAWRCAVKECLRQYRQVRVGTNDLLVVPARLAGAVMCLSVPTGRIRDHEFRTLGLDRHRFRTHELPHGLSDTELELAAQLCSVELSTARAVDAARLLLADRTLSFAA